MRKSFQKVVGTIDFPDTPENLEPKTIREEIEGTNTQNLRSKVSNWVKLKLTQYSVADGATIVIEIEPIAPDEYARPDPDRK